jgi:DNA-binding Lrp family transcriptional regulator
VAERVRRLETAEVIAGYRADLNLAAQARDRRWTRVAILAAPG